MIPHNHHPSPKHNHHFASSLSVPFPPLLLPELHQLWEESLGKILESEESLALAYTAASKQNRHGVSITACRVDSTQKSTSSSSSSSASASPNNLQDTLIPSGDADFGFVAINQKSVINQLVVDHHQQHEDKETRFNGILSPPSPTASASVAAVCRFTLTNEKHLPLLCRMLLLPHANTQFNVRVIQQERNQNGDIVTPGGNTSSNEVGHFTLYGFSCVDVLIQCSSSNEPGYNAQWILFSFSSTMFPLAPAVSPATPSPSLSLLDYSSVHFTIIRKMSAINVTKSLVSALSKETPPFFPLHVRETFFTAAEITLPSVYPNFPIVSTFLSQYELPATLQSFYHIQHRLKSERSQQQFSTAWKSYVHSFLTDPSIPLHSSTASIFARHLRRWWIVLNAEELQMQNDLQHHNLYYISIRSYYKQRSKGSDGYVKITCPGVSEGRPALVLGGMVLLRLADLHPSVEIRCYVCKVVEDEVLLSFPVKQLCKLLHIQPKTLFSSKQYLFHVSFTLDRTGLRYMYRALTWFLQHEDAAALLFPHIHATTVTEQPTSPQPTQPLPWFNPLVNEEQQAAVQHIMERTNAMMSVPFRSPTATCVPYIIHGPPGTGKTLTLVEAILQILFHSVEAYVPCLLVCTASNYASDLIADRLRHHLKPTELLRLNSFTRHTAVLPAVQKYCVYDAETELFALPSLSTLLSYRIIVCTCGFAGYLHDISLPRGHFTHVLFDESCQSLEPEMLIPLYFATPRTVIVLSGDPLQLGADMHTTMAAQYHLPLSLQERLSHTQLYQHTVHIQASSSSASSSSSSAQQEQQQHQHMTLLVKNYRSHPALLQLTSALFYNQSLQACADTSITHALTSWKALPNKDNFPLLFYGVVGVDVYECESSSFYNPIEACVIVEIIEDLLNQDISGVVVDKQDITVICPFRKQVLRMRQLLRERRLSSIRVDAVDALQGQESKVVILSTVIAKKRDVMRLNTSATNATTGNAAVPAILPDYDTTAPLGILRNAKRFNVATSRAQALTVVVGNPFLLAQEKNWSQLLCYAVQNNAYAGCAIPVSISAALLQQSSLSNGHNQLDIADELLLDGLDRADDAATDVDDDADIADLLSLRWREEEEFLGMWRNML